MDMQPKESDASDNQAMMEHCALEAMNAIESKDKGAFLEAFHCLIADVLSKIGPDDGDMGDK